MNSFPVTKLKYYHRPINVDKMNLYNFCTNYVEKKYRIINKKLEKINNPTTAEIKQLYELFDKCKYEIKHYMTYDNFSKFFINNDIIHIYIIRNNNIITDFISLMNINRYIAKFKDIVREVSLYYFSINTISMKNIFKELIMLLKNENIDILSCFDYPVELNEKFLLDNDISFLKGTSEIYMYIHNYDIRTKSIQYFIP